jgi:hypothetical protein
MRSSLALACLFTLAGLVHAQGPVIGAKVGGTIAPDGKTQIQVDLPNDLHQENIASKGLGCCVFRSIDHAARWSNQPALIGFPEWMVSKGIPGGGNPQKVDQLVPKIAADRGLPTPRYVQAETKDLELLKLALKTGRMVCVTYSRSPTGRYGGKHIDHMVNACHADSSWIAILDNNYIKSYEWVTPDEFQRICNEGKLIWFYVPLDNPPPPPPKN